MCVFTLFYFLCIKNVWQMWFVKSCQVDLCLLFVQITTPVWKLNFSSPYLHGESQAPSCNEVYACHVLRSGCISCHLSGLLQEKPLIWHLRYSSLKQSRFCTSIALSKCSYLSASYGKGHLGVWSGRSTFLRRPSHLNVRSKVKALSCWHYGQRRLHRADFNEIALCFHRFSFIDFSIGAGRTTNNCVLYHRKVITL